MILDCVKCQIITTIIVANIECNNPTMIIAGVVGTLIIIINLPPEVDKDNSSKITKEEKEREVLITTTTVVVDQDIVILAKKALVHLRFRDPE